MKYLHIFSYDSNDKFSKPYIDFINDNFDSKDHFFFLTSSKDTKNNNKHQYKNVEVLPYSIKSIWILSKVIYKYEKILFHGLSNNKYIEVFLIMKPWVLKKSFWLIWGGDLYLYESRNKNFKSKMHEILRRYIIKNMGGLITHIKGDYELAKEWYGVKGQYHYSFMYTSNLFKEYNLTKTEDEKLTYIMVGNSGLDTNNHLEIFEKLSKFKHEKIKIICPLSYAYESNVRYKNEVIKSGKEIFGDNFVALTEFMPFSDYLTLLFKIDIAIFNHKRQQAVGNITTLLGLGKKVYIRDSITTWNFCSDHNLKVYKANENFADLFEKMDEKIKQQNIDNIQIKFSKKKLIEDWKKIFYEDEYT